MRNIALIRIAVAAIFVATSLCYEQVTIGLTPTPEPSAPADPSSTATESPTPTETSTVSPAPTETPTVQPIGQTPASTPAVIIEVTPLPGPPSPDGYKISALPDGSSFTPNCTTYQNVRALPDTSAAIVGQLTCGEARQVFGRMDILGTGDVWVCVDPPIFDDGFVTSECLQVAALIVGDRIFGDLVVPSG